MENTAFSATGQEKFWGDVQSNYCKRAGYIFRVLCFKTLRVKLSELFEKLCLEDIHGIVKLAGCKYRLWKAFID